MSKLSGIARERAEGDAAPQKYQENLLII